MNILTNLLLIIGTAFGLVAGPVAQQDIFEPAPLEVLSLSAPAGPAVPQDDCTYNFPGYPEIPDCPNEGTISAECLEAARIEYFHTMMVGPGSVKALRILACEKSKLAQEALAIIDRLTPLLRAMKLVHADAVEACQNGNPDACQAADDLQQQIDDTEDLLTIANNNFVTFTLQSLDALGNAVQLEQMALDTWNWSLLYCCSGQ